MNAFSFSGKIYRSLSHRLSIRHFTAEFKSTQVMRMLSNGPIRIRYSSERDAIFPGAVNPNVISYNINTAGYRD